MKLETAVVAFGTRPEAIKLAPVIQALREAEVRVVVISTGQHRSLLRQALKFFEIEPDHDLAVMSDGQPLHALLARIVEGVGPILEREQPDVVFVEGDTASTLGVALGAFHARCPIGHVEAGLRSHDKSQPFPEEAYRVLVSHLATWHFCPTDLARDNLLREGIDAQHVFVTGNPGVDATRWGREQLPAHAKSPLPVGPPVLERFLLVTCHRRESFGEGIASVCRALKEIVLDRPDLHVVWPVHLNPHVQKAVSADLEGVPRVHCVEPVDYPTMLRLLSRCLFVVTDSGGIQEEAPEFGKPVLVLRQVTERSELVEAGGALLVGTDPRPITSAVARLLEDKAYYARMAGVPNPFGDGQAGLRIVRALQRA